MNTTGNISKITCESRQVIERYCAHVNTNVVMSRETNMGKSQNRCLEAHRCDNKECKHRTGN